MKVKTVIYLGLLALVVAIGFFTTGCGEQEKEPEETNPYVKEIEVNPIQVETVETETILTETILWENVETQTWD